MSSDDENGLKSEEENLADELEDLKDEGGMDDLFGEDDEDQDTSAKPT